VASCYDLHRLKISSSKGGLFNALRNARVSNIRAPMAVPFIRSGLN